MTVACPVEDRLAIQDLLIAYAHAVDSLHDVDGICDVFVEDAVFDLSGIKFPSLNGHAEIRKFFEDTFDAMSAHAHYLTNFAITSYEGGSVGSKASIMGSHTQPLGPIPTPWYPCSSGAGQGRGKAGQGQGNWPGHGS